MNAAHRCRKGRLECVRRSLYFQNHRLGHAVQAQIARYLQLVLTRLLHLRRFEGGGGELGDVEEIGRLQVAVAFGLVGVDRAEVDGDVDSGLGHVFVVELDCSFDLLEAPLHGGYHHVAHTELDTAVGRI